MKTQALLDIVKKRGLKIVVVEGRPVLKRPVGNEGVTDKLLSVLKHHRQRIIDLLAPNTRQSQGTVT